MPVDNKVPFELASYHLTVPALAVADIVAVPGIHREASVVEVMVGIAVTVPVTAVLEEVQPPEVAST